MRRPSAPSRAGPSSLYGGKKSRARWRPGRLLDRDRVERRARPVRYVQRLGGHEELVAPVVRAILGELLEVPDLAERDPEVPYQALVDREESFGGVLERLDLDRHVVHRNRGDRLLVDPVDALERDARRAVEELEPLRPDREL